MLLANTSHFSLFGEVAEISLLVVHLPLHPATGVVSDKIRDHRVIRQGQQQERKAHKPPQRPGKEGTVSLHIVQKDSKTFPTVSRAGMEE